MPVFNIPLASHSLSSADGLILRTTAPTDITLPTSGSLVGSGTNTATFSSAAGINNAYLLTVTGSAGADTYPFGLRLDMTNSGTATPSSGLVHGAAALFNAQDVAGSKTPLIGVEGKIQGFGTDCPSYTGVVSDCLFTGASWSGTLIGYSITRMSITADGSTPLAQGTAIGIFIPEFTGGAAQIGILSKEAVRVDNVIGAYDATGASALNMSHNGTDGTIATTTGNLNINSTAILMNTNALLPLVNATPLGINSNRWAGNLHSSTTIGLAASVTPANNGELMFQATSNTSLTFKYKGADGTVRSASVTLS